MALFVEYYHMLDVIFTVSLAESRSQNKITTKESTIITGDISNKQIKFRESLNCGSLRTKLIPMLLHKLSYICQKDLRTNKLVRFL